MTQKDKIAFAKVYSKFNARIERYALSFFYKTLKKQVVGLKELIDTYPIEVVPFYLNSIVKEETFKVALDEFYQKAGKAFLKFHASQFALTIKKDKDPTQQAIDNINLAFRDAEKIAELAKIAQTSEIADRVTKVTGYTQKLIKDTIERGISENKTKPQIAKEINLRTGGVIAKKRALVIARTETTFISSKAAEINIQDSPFKIQKTWIPVKDMRTRPDHLEMLSKKPIGKDELFNVGGVQMKYPGDPSGGAANVCNCRCAIFYAPVPNQETPLSQVGGGVLSDLLIGQILGELFGVE